MHSDDGLSLDLFTVGRGLASASIIALVGACAFALLLPRWRQPGDDQSSLSVQSLHRIWQVAIAASAGLILADLIRGYGQVVSFLEPQEYFSFDVARPILLETTWGHGWTAQILAALTCLPLAFFAKRRPRPGLLLLTAGAGAVILAAPLTGHALEHPWGSVVGVALHAVHILGGSIWIGTLFSMVWCGLMLARKSDAKAAARMVHAFSPMALIGAGLAVTAGVLLAIGYVGSFEDLWETEYGLVLLVKVGLLGVTMVLGAWNWKNVSPGLGTHAATLTLRWSASFELMFAFLIIAATAVLVALPAPGL